MREKHYKNEMIKGAIFMDEQLDEMVDLLQMISDTLTSIDGKLDNIDINTKWLDDGLDNIDHSISALHSD